MKTQKVQMMDVVIDPSIQVRGVSDHSVTRYRQAMKTGAKFPPIVLEKGTNRVVCGNQRFFAYKTLLQPEDKIEVIFEKYEADADLLMRAANDNATHGDPLSTWDKKQIIQRLLQYDVSIEEISKAIGTPVTKVEEWAGLTVVVRGGNGNTEVKPVKHGLEHLQGKEITSVQYKEHEQKDRGVPAKNLATTLTRWINNEWIDMDDEKTVVNLTELYEALHTLFSE